ncbi:MAG TPA: 3-hydroxylacyl-ACP dehydratase [Alphaproteobacteria bacterium]|nr:3-hydroxylacyl-ACP dehydratase [Alphaproteobacteria bacterium]
MDRDAVLDRAEIAALIPHAGDMVLLDKVEAWTRERIVCSTNSHRRPGNPLGRPDGVPAICGVEYGGQAMAVHGALTTNQPGRQGLIANVRSVVLSVRTLDGDHEITVEASRLAGSDDGVIYQFSLQAAGRELISGQAMVLLLGDPDSRL